MPLDDVQLFYDDLPCGTIDGENLAGLSTIAAGDDHHRIPFTNMSLLQRVHDYRYSWLKHFRSQRDDFHKFFPAKLPCDRSENAGPDGLTLFVNEHTGIPIEFNIGAVFAPDFFRRPHDHCPADVAFFHRRLWNGFLDGHNNDISQ